MCYNNHLGIDFNLKGVAFPLLKILLYVKTISNFHPFEHVFIIKAVVSYSVYGNVPYN